MTEPNQRPIIIGYDGSPAANAAVDAAAELFRPRWALVVTVWEPKQAWLAVAPPAAPSTPVPIDIRVATELEEALYEGAKRMACQGADMAGRGGLDAQPHVVADDVTVAETLARLADEHLAGAVVVGSHGHTAVRELLFGSTTRGVLKHASCPTVIVREPNR